MTGPAVESFVKLTTETLRPIIAQVAVAQITQIKREFTDDDTSPWDTVGTPKCWRRLSKQRRDDGTVERIFDHNEFDDQLRAYVISDSTDTTVQKIWFAGE